MPVFGGFWALLLLDLVPMLVPLTAWVDVLLSSRHLEFHLAMAFFVPLFGKSLCFFKLLVLLDWHTQVLMKGRVGKCNSRIQCL
jgi:hypothetical protein